MDQDSKTSMVNITKKQEVIRIAKAEGEITLKRKSLEAIKEKQIEKGDVITAAKLAAINAVKKTSDLILLAHPILITDVNVTLLLDDVRSSIKVVTEVRSISRTGVELEAIMGVMTGLLTIFDMCKYLEKDEHGQYRTTNISNIRVVEKLKRHPISG